MGNLRTSLFTLATILGLTVTGALADGEETPESASAPDEKTCIEEAWPWADGPPASIEELLAGVEMLRRECASAQSLFSQGRVNVRGAPGLTADRIGQLKRGEQVDAQCGIEGDEYQGSSEWCAVGEGYVHASLLAETEPPVVPVAPQRAAAQQQGDICAGYNTCIRLCEHGHPGEWFYVAFRINGISRDVFEIRNCKPAEMSNGTVMGDPCGGGGIGNIVHHEGSEYLRVRCP